MMKVAFTDVDGVLITGLPPFDWKTPDPKCVAALNSLLAADESLMLVISSCWRVGMTRIELCDLFNKWGVTPGRILDRTGEMRDSRGEEIQTWLAERSKHRDDIDKFIIIDDDLDMGPLLPKLIRTNRATGLTQPDIQRAIGALQ